MADEVTASVRISAVKNNSSLNYQTKNFTFDMAGANPLDNTQNIGTGAENVQMGDAGAGAFVFAENLDPTNYVQLGKDASGFVPFTDIPAGQFAAIRVPSGVTLQAKANTGACNVRFIIIPA